MSKPKTTKPAASYVICRQCNGQGGWIYTQIIPLWPNSTPIANWCPSCKGTGTNWMPIPPLPEGER